MRPADELQLKAAKTTPLMDSPDPSKIQSTVGTVLSIYTVPRQLGLNEAGASRGVII